MNTNSKHICPAFDYVFGCLKVCVCVCVCVCVRDEEVVLGRTVLQRSISVTGKGVRLLYTDGWQCSGKRTFTECPFTKGEMARGDRGK